jgi:DNA-binding transcriptional MerR regulator
MSDAAVNRRSGAPAGAVSLQDAAARVGVAASTLRRWAREGLIAPYAGTWSPAAVSHAKIVARLRERGHSLREIRQASEQGRLAFGYVDELFDTGEAVYTLEEASRETGLDPALVDRIADVRLKRFTESTEVFIARDRRVGRNGDGRNGR